MNPQRVPSCPDCGKPMVLRTARRGRYAGRQFYGCSGYPECKTIIDIDDVDFEITTAPPEQPQPQIALPPIKTRQLFHNPISVECPSNKEGTQSTLFETISVIETLPKILKQYSVSQDLIHAFSQWRLDYLLPVFGSEIGDIRTVISVAEKILKRGSTTIYSPLLRNFIIDKFGKLSNLSDQDWIGNINYFTLHNRSKFVQNIFDSDAEKTFYFEILPLIANRIDIHPWVFPQISASSLTQRSIDPASSQRIDYLICHPSGLRCVVEIDGLQHTSSREADNARDELLIKNGYRVIRIPVEEIEEGNGRNIDLLQNELNKLLVHTGIDPADNIQEIVGLVKAASQIQIALLEALKGGHLSLSKKCTWNLFLDTPSWLIDENKWFTAVTFAINDFVNLIRSIYFLHKGVSIDIDFCLHPLDQHHQSLPGDTVLFTFGSATKKSFNRFPVFVISDIYIPVKIASYLQGSDTVRIQNPDYSKVKYLLNFVFQKEDFLEGQWEAIERTIKGFDSILLLPTGGGKTIAFQLASLLLSGPCLVIDPLISLIDDQIDNLQNFGIDRAVGITSQLSSDEKKDALDNFSKGYYLFAYVAPERLQMQDFRDGLRALTANMPISVIAIDEAHCVSEWGHDFRTSYLNIARNSRNYCEKDGVIPPLLGLTGTASRSVLRDVRRELEISEFDSIITPKSFDREELNYRVLSCLSNEKNARLKGFLSSLPGTFGVGANYFFSNQKDDTKAGLIFYPHVNGQFGIVEGYNLIRQNICNSIALYSGKTPKNYPGDKWPEYKRYSANRFKNNEVNILACTNAFGMGIDKPNVRFTVHMNVPRSIEAFYQEAGRAGRDHQRAECCLIISVDNPQRAREVLDPTTPLEEIDKKVKKIPWGEDDDITRMMYFHTNAFRGIQNEIVEVEKIIEELGDPQVIKSVSIIYSDNDQRNRSEKAIHRLVIIGVIEDYKINYANNEIMVRLSGNEKDALISSYIKYVRNYDRKLAETTHKRIVSFMELPFKQFVLQLINDLITNFIYNIIELGRRRSFSEMLETCSTDSTNQSVRSRILNYLDLGEYSDSLEDAREQPEQLKSNLIYLIEEIGSPNEAAELRGQTSRLLEAYPNNPALLLFRSLAEAMCKDRNDDLVIENYVAFVKYAISKDVWDLPINQVFSVSKEFIDQIETFDMNLAQNLVLALINQISDDRNNLRLYIESFDEKFTLPAIFLLMSQLSSSVEKIIR